MGDKKKKNRENNHEWEELCFMLLSYLSKTVAAYKTTDWEIHFEDCCDISIACQILFCIIFYNFLKLFKYNNDFPPPFPI